MKFFSKFGEIILTIFSYTGAVVIAIVNLPSTIRQLNLRSSGPEKIRETVRKIDTEEIGEKISKITNTVDQKYNSKTEGIDSYPAPDMVMETEDSDIDEGPIIIKNVKYDSKEKESTVLRLQIASGAFLVASVLYVFHFMAFYIYAIVGLLLVGFIGYALYNKIKLMYPQDFNAYRDFFLLYVAVGIILVIVGTNTNLTLAFPFQFFPSFSLLVFAVIAVVAVFLIFRIRYYRDYTYGEVVEAGNNTSHVKVDYDIRSNVKPDIYIVENNGLEVSDNEIVKMEIDGSTFNMNGNRPSKIIGKVDRFH